MIKIEILSEDGLETSVAFYYQIPPGQQLPAAVDQNRDPAGDKLTPEEIQYLKDGKIYEVLWTSDTSGLDVPQRRSKLVNEWAQGVAGALSAYKSKYQAVGSYYDGVWH